ncbi:hypothetical protein [Bifidobacterium panos]|uniref:Uncharacterized protein n=1 Tax=Bifidobacterium panos TaxID=2675321 RepID=A0ABX1SY86_9BIFI|nr:hypothetical protein [Bifidobacterium sp. DSM 109963]NMN02810.1 hypothetical protein [Bifidobacterium sp. DSM 109963]
MNERIAMTADEARKSIGVSEKIWREEFARFGHPFGNATLYLPDELEQVIRDSPQGKRERDR